MADELVEFAFGEDVVAFAFEGERGWFLDPGLLHETRLVHQCWARGGAGDGLLGCATEVEFGGDGEFGLGGGHLLVALGAAGEGAAGGGVLLGGVLLVREAVGHLLLLLGLGLLHLLLLLWVSLLVRRLLSLL